MNANEIIALAPGKPLDEAVHTYCFNNAGPVQNYSTDDAAGLPLLDRLPLFIGRVSPRHPRFDPSRPWVSGTLSHDPNFKGDITSLRVTANTRAIALCKAALIFTVQPAPEAPRRPAAQPRSNPAQQEAAKDIARRVGTKQARNPKAGAQEAPAKRQQTASAGAKPAFNSRPQPSAFKPASGLPPMPKRPGKWVGPTPLPVAGGSMPKA